MATTFRRQQTQAMQRRLARRPGATGLLGLAGQFQSQIEQLTSQYQTEFSQYQQRVAEMMAPYEQAMQRYTNEQLPAYEAASASFRDALAGYESQLSDYLANPTYTEQTTLPSRTTGGGSYQVQYNGTWYNAMYDVNLPDEVALLNMAKPNASVRITRRRPEPTFNQVAPEAPVLPEAPQIGEFDQSRFDRRRQELQQGFQREVAERRGARMAANRRTSRTMLSGVQ